MKHVCFIILLISAVSWCPLAKADVDYLTEIKPLLANKCYSCHGVLKQESGLRLETLALMKTGGDGGAVLFAGKSADSLLVERVSAGDDSRMPPTEDGAALTADEVNLLRRWIDEGAKAPVEETPQGPRDHWAFQSVQPMELPSGSGDANPIDVLLQLKRDELGLKTQPPAQRSLLIRRLYLNLIGLPPTLQQLRDKRPFNEIVDELLASPHHGERWGRHWMDVWRYSDWYGLGAQLRNSQKHMWHWRDWIIKSLNSDKGYDRMVQEMIAGDEIAPNDRDAITATGFLARNYYLFNRTTWLDSTIEHTGKAFLGLTLNCAKCHDHKYDPITHEDYYSFRAIFEPHHVRLDPVRGVLDFDKDGLPRVYDDSPFAKTMLHLKGDPKNPDKDTKIVPRIPELFAKFQPKIEAITLPVTAYSPGRRGIVQEDHLQAAISKLETARKEDASAKRKFSATQNAVTRRHINKKDKTDQSYVSHPTSPFPFVDEFDSFNKYNWKLVGDNWKYKDGMLLQTKPTREREYLSLRLDLPRDFEVKCRFTTTGGATYKSVTFRFDESEDGKYANFVYTSAHAPGPKIQVAYTRNGASVYPAEGRKAYPIKVGETQELKFSVRDRLVNVWLNGKFAVAYVLPDRRPEGWFTLQGFDATVAYDRIEFRALPDDTKMIAAKNKSAATPQLALKIAAAELAAAKASLESLKATIAADNSRFKNADDSPDSELARTAATQQLSLQLAQAELERVISAGDPKKLKAANAKIRKANDRLKSMFKNLANETKYEPINASRKALEGPEQKQSDSPAVFSDISSGRRTALAKWIASKQNPLTARVAVNHIWMRHFGEPLVESVFDFGLRAKKPLHADILDFLAADFMQHGWSFKRLHRLIVTSKTYRLSSSVRNADSRTMATDPDNHYFWRMNNRRMESQVVRDSLLHLAGTLDLKLGGQSLDVGNGSTRRSLYYKHSRDSQDKFLSMFDDADLLQCYRRSESVVPQQALALANSEVSMQNAKRIAASISKSLEDDNQTSFIKVAIETLLGREPSDGEVDFCQTFCKDLTRLLQKDEKTSTEVPNRVRTRLIHTLLNHNDFISIR